MILNDNLEFIRLEKLILEIITTEKLRKQNFDSADYLNGDIILLTQN